MYLAQITTLTNDISFEQLGPDIGTFMHLTCIDVFLSFPDADNENMETGQFDDADNPDNMEQ